MSPCLVLTGTLGQTAPPGDTRWDQQHVRLDTECQIALGPRDYTSHAARSYWETGRVLSLKKPYRCLTRCLTCQGVRACDTLLSQLSCWRQHTSRYQGQLFTIAGSNPLCCSSRGEFPAVHGSHPAGGVKPDSHVPD